MIRARRGLAGRKVVWFGAKMSDVIVAMRRTLLSCTSLARKGCDWIVANDVSPATGVMGGDRNTVHLLTRKGEQINVDSWPAMTKEEVAAELVARIAKTVGESS